MSFHLLVLGDQHNEREPLLHALERTGVSPTRHLVATEEAYMQALAVPYDLVIVSTTVVPFTCADALRLLHDRQPETPLLVIAPAEDEAVALACVQQGAYDYWLIGQTQRLEALVTQLLRDRAARQQRETLTQELATTTRLLHDTRRQLVQEVRESTRLRETLHKIEARYRLLAEHSTELIARCTPEFIILYASPISQRLLGYEPHELVGVSLIDLVVPAEQTVVQVVCAAVADSAEAATVSYQAVRKDQRVIWLEMNIQMIEHYSTGFVQEYLILARDITARKQAEQEIQRLRHR